MTPAMAQVTLNVGVNLSLAATSCASLWPGDPDQLRAQARQMLEEEGLSRDTHLAIAARLILAVEIEDGLKRGGANA